MCSKCERGKQIAEPPRHRPKNVGPKYEASRESETKTGPKRERGAHSDIATATPIEDSRPQVSKTRAKLAVVFCDRDPYRGFGGSNIKNPSILYVLRLHLSRLKAVVHVKTRCKRRSCILPVAGTRLGFKSVEIASVALIDA